MLRLPQIDRRNEKVNGRMEVFALVEFANIVHFPELFTIQAKAYKPCVVLCIFRKS